MRQGFEGYFRPSDAEFKNLWEQCRFVFDTSALLHVYRYGAETRSLLLDVIEKLADRCWLPHQVALEFHQNRASLVVEQKLAYERVTTLLDDSSKSLREGLKEYRRHWNIDVGQLLGPFDQALEAAKQALQSWGADHPDLLFDDPLRERLVAVFDKRTGAPYQGQVLLAKEKEADDRLKDGLPPGYMDAKKTEPAKRRGDVFVWLQTLEFATVEQKPIILVSEDTKQDWWLEVKGRTLGPRPELISEMQRVAGVSFYMYTSAQFLKYAREYLGLAPATSAEKEIEKVRRGARLRRPKVRGWSEYEAELLKALGVPEPQIPTALSLAAPFPHGSTVRIGPPPDSALQDRRSRADQYILEALRDAARRSLKATDPGIPPADAAPTPSEEGLGDPSGTDH